MAFRMARQTLYVSGVLIVGSFLAPLAVAGAQPGNGPLIHTSCSYDQLVAATRVEAPRAAAELDQRPAAQERLRSFVSMTVEQRQQELARLLAEKPEWQAKIDEKWNTPEGQEKVQRMARIADTCQSY